MVQLLQTTVSQLLMKSNIHLPRGPGTLPVYPRELKTYISEKAVMQMCVAAVFTIVKNWQQPTGSVAGERATSHGVIQATEHHSAAQREQTVGTGSHMAESYVP